MAARAAPTSFRQSLFRPSSLSLLRSSLSNPKKALFSPSLLSLSSVSSLKSDTTPLSPFQSLHSLPRVEFRRPFSSSKVKPPPDDEKRSDDEPDDAILDEIGAELDGKVDDESDDADDVLDDGSDKVDDGLDDASDRMDNILDDVDDGLDDVSDGLDNALDDVDDGLDDVRDGMDNRLDDVDEGLDDVRDGLDNGLDDVDDGLDDVSDGLDDVRDGLDNGLDDVDDRLDDVSDGLDNGLDDVRDEMDNGLDDVDDESGDVSDGLDDRLTRYPSPVLSVKEKKELASYAHGLGKKLKSQQVGKSGVTPTLVSAFSDALEANELLKLKVHGNCPGELPDVIRLLEASTGSVAVGRIGRSVILYRPSITKMQQAREKKTVKSPRRPRPFKAPFSESNGPRDQSRRPFLRRNSRRPSSA